MHCVHIEPNKMLLMWKRWYESGQTWSGKYFIVWVTIWEVYMETFRFYMELQQDRGHQQTQSVSRLETHLRIHTTKMIVAACVPDHLQVRSMCPYVKDIYTCNYNCPIVLGSTETNVNTTS